MPRDDYTGKGKYARIATALNALAKWQNNFGVAAPLLLRRQPGGGVRLGIDLQDSAPGGFSGETEFVAGFRWNAGQLQLAVVTATYADGLLQNLSQPAWQTVFDTGECPE